MCTITGTLQSIVDEQANQGTVEVALCNYGAQVPRIDGAGLGALITDRSPAVADDGSFSFTVEGNDHILPANTYYTVTVKDDNGDIVQCNAYQFTEGSDYDLNETEPFDPSDAPPPGIPPLLENLLESLPFSSTPVFDGAMFQGWEILLTGDVTGGTIANMQPGNLYTFIIVQDGTGGHRFTWPFNVFNASPINPDPNGYTIQTFVADEFSHLLPISAATWMTL